ncbi:nuclear exosome regulator NRDE2 isoform X2 [Lycorma delicatula]|uniref:nuclear exosome regulator NRDE2 isoform X2 n=1 Tax=Lycorma delicatula TaxID=130591 RepID=UPI003F51969C
MALFPAYCKPTACESENIVQSSSNVTELDTSWLRNPSFIVSDTKNDRNYSDEIEKDINSTLECNDEEDKQKYSESHTTKSEYKRSEQTLKSKNEIEKKFEYRHKRKKEKKRIKRKHEKSGLISSKSAPTVTEVDGMFYTDKRREPGNLQVKTLSRPAVPLYNNPKRKLCVLKDNCKKVSKSKSYRYYTFDFKGIGALDVKEDDSFVEESTTAKDVGVNCEKEITEKTRHFNEKLENEPDNVKLWLEYVKFQNIVCKFEQTHSSSKSIIQKLIAEKKLSILEKAISLNPLCEELLNEKFHLAEIVYPPEKLLAEALELVNKDKTNLTLTRAVIRCTQFSLSRCTVPSVINAFVDALERLQQGRMRHLSNKYNEGTKSISKLMLVLLLECGLFMRQAGLWEQLIALLKQYLEMNVSTLVNEVQEIYKLNVSINEELVCNTEESILKSNLPLSAIWLRIERLRESCYWLPLTNYNSDESKNIDPQRFVFFDDVKNLTQLIVPSSLNLHLIFTVMYLLKVPLLPAKHIVSEIVRLNEIPYAVDTVEILLTAFYPMGLVTVANDQHFLKGVTDLVTGPQYLKDKLGKAEFLTLIGNLFESAGKQLGPLESVALYSWYIRFHRYIICLSAVDSDICNENDKKKIRKFSKDKLKDPHFRNELQLYNEHALLEREMGNVDACLNILLTAMKLRHFTYEKAPYVSLYRNTVETLLSFKSNENRKKAVDVLCNLVNCDNVNDALEKFKHVNIEATVSFLKSDEMSKKVELIEVITPHWCVEWIACNSYFLMLTESVWAASGLVQEYIDKLLPNISPCTLGKLICEGLYEILVSILHFHSHETKTSFHVLQDILQTSHKLFPSNIYFLHTLSLIETSAGSAGSPWWKLSSLFTSSLESVLPRLFLVFILRYRISVSLQEGGWSESSGHNLMSSLLNHLISNDISKKSPLIWRLYLQFISVCKSGGDLRTSFYRAVEECPWAKALYVDAIQLVPENIQEIQDLLIEKELRLHSLTDELDILRNGSV